MTPSEKFFLELIRHALKGKHGPDDIIVAPAEVNLKTVCVLSHRQNVSAVVCESLDSIDTGSLDNQKWSKAKFRLIGDSLATEDQYASHKDVMTALSSLYRKHGIRMMVLKGYGLSLNWPEPSHRSPGDLDIYLFGDWKKGDKVVHRELGLEVEFEHEHHTTFRYKGVMVENHYDFINTKAHKGAHAIEKELKLLSERSCIEYPIDDAVIYFPSPDFNAIFLIRHMGQHFAGERINMRQVLDWGFFIRKHSSEVNWDYVIPFLKSMGIYTFFNQINAICVDYLGLDETGFPSIERDDELEERILCDILSPEFSEKRPKNNIFRILIYKFRRWWQNRWKHRLVYNEPLLPMFMTLLWSKLRHLKSIKD